MPRSDYYERQEARRDRLEERLALPHAGQRAHEHGDSAVSYTDHTGTTYETFEDWVHATQPLGIHHNSRIDPERCRARVYSEGRWANQCHRRASKGPFGAFCGTHAPIVDGSKHRAQDDARATERARIGALEQAAQAAKRRLNPFVPSWLPYSAEGARGVTIGTSDAMKLADTLEAVAAFLLALPHMSPDDVEAQRLELLAKLGGTR